MDTVEELLDQLTQQPPSDRRGLFAAKRAVARRARQPLLRNDVLLRRYRTDVEQGRRSPSAALERTLTLNAVRSISGIATVTVITEPYACPGRCVYCPTEARAPKSYLPNEPAVLRAIRNGYDPYEQVTSRLRALHDTGHPTDKLELIIKGGTWSFYPEPYQEWFVQRCFDAANAFQSNDTGAQTSADLLDAQRRNETAGGRIIGLTIETRPDYVTLDEVRRLRRLGVTRVELGVQSLEDRILALILRDHSTRETREATALLRRHGFKIAYHLMPNLPGASPADDRRTFEQLFADPAYRPDALKIYPCVVTKTAELYEWWQQGRYRPYDDEVLTELLIDLKALVPPYVRIERVIRDIPSISIEAGCKFINLREEVHRRMRARGLRCRCIRCREIRRDAAEDLQLTRRDYEVAAGREVFLSIEGADDGQLAAMLRLHAPSADAAAPGFAALERAAVVRELHTYGQHVPIDGRDRDAAQHRGLGRRLLAEAERIAREELGAERVAVIAGVGVREYYRKLGYRPEDTYMVKNLINADTANT